MDRNRTVQPTPLTRAAAMAMLVVVLATATYLVLLYPSLPDLLPVHFKASGAPNGWQYRTLPRVLIPVGVQTMLALVLGAVAALLLSRPHGDHDVEAPDVRAAAVAAEAVVLIALVWVAFQAYAGVSLARLWVDPRVRLPFYTAGEVLGGLVSLLVFVRANRLLGRPEPRPFVQSQWRFGQLYKNADDPALFVPTRDGRRWTLNFGRPVAGALLGLILVVGMLGPTLLLALALR